MKNLDESDLKVLFESLGQILHNQVKIIEHLSLSRHDNWERKNTKAEELSNECFVIAQEYRDIIEEQEEERRKEYKRCGDDPMINF